MTRRYTPARPLGPVHQTLVAHGPSPNVVRFPEALTGPLVGLAVIGVALFTPGLPTWGRFTVAIVGLAAAGIILALASVKRWKRLAEALGLEPEGGEHPGVWAGQPNLVGKIGRTTVRLRTMEHGSKTQRRTWIEYAVAAPEGPTFQIWERGLRARISGSLGLPEVTVEGAENLVVHGDPDAAAKLLGGATTLDSIGPLGTLTLQDGWLHQRLPGNPASADAVRKRLEELGKLAKRLE